MYTDSTLPFLDAGVCADLCKGRPIHYKIRENSGITNEMLCQHMVPNIRMNYCESILVVLGWELLWRIFNEKQNKVVPKFIVNHAMTAYLELENNKLAVGVDPVKKSTVDGVLSCVSINFVYYLVCL